MLIEKRRLLPNYTLRPSYPSNLSELNVIDVYKDWYVFAMINMNRYIELLHKQLIRKGKTSRRNVYHPFYPNAYRVNSHNIKSASKKPYNKYSSDDMGLNQLFVGQSPYKWYQGDPSSKNGIYHDICEIEHKYSLGGARYLYNFPKINLLFNKDDALEYPNFYYYDESLNLATILKEALKGVSYTDIVEIAYKGYLKNEIGIKFEQKKGNIFNKFETAREVTSLDDCYDFLLKPIFENNTYRYVRLSDIKIPKIKTKTAEVMKYDSFNKYYTYTAQVVVIDDFLKEFKALNPNLTFLDDCYYYEAVTVNTNNNNNNNKNARESDPSETKKIQVQFYLSNFKDFFKTLKTPYYSPYAKPLFFCENNYIVCYKEPYIAYGEPPYGKLPNRKSILGNTSKIEGIAIKLYPLYNNTTHTPYGRRDKWVALWDEFYRLFVEERASKWEKLFVPVISIVLAGLTWYIGGQGAWLSTLIGISAGTAAAITLGITLVLAIGSLSGNNVFKVLNAVWSVVNFVGSWGANDWNLAADFTKTPLTASKDMSIFESGLNIFSNTLSGLNKVFDVINAITAPNNTSINENPTSNDSDETQGGFGLSDEQERAKNELNPCYWYSLETQDFIGEI